MRIGLLYILFHLSCQALSQQISSVYFHLDKLTLKHKILSDSLGYSHYKTQALESFALSGYTGVTQSDSLLKGKDLHLYFSYIKRFDKILLIPDSLGTDRRRDILSSSGFSATQNDINDVLNQLENSGYPFSKFVVTYSEEKEDRLLLSYHIDSGMFFIIDKITIRSKEKFHEPTILNIVNLEAGETYNEEKIAAADELLKASGLYRAIRPAEVVFRNGKAEVFLYIERENASDADGYVGFQQDKTSGRLALNGFFHVSLKNAFHRSESILIHWKNNPSKTQNLNLKFEYPYVLKTPIGIGARLNLQKQDSSFVRADSYFDLSYLNPYYRVGIYYQLESSTTLLQTTNLNFRDYKKSTIGVSGILKPFFTDQAEFYHPQFAVSAGFFNYRSDSVEQVNSASYNLKYLFRYAHVIDFLRYFHLNNSIQFEGLSASNALSRNELIFFGGLNSLRGFYELELTGNDVVLINNEIEFAPVESLSMKILYDYASWQNAGSNSAQAVGFGFSFLAGNIRLELIIANGWENQNPLLITNTKIHLGFKSNF